MIDKEKYRIILLILTSLIAVIFFLAGAKDSFSVKKTYLAVENPENYSIVEIKNELPVEQKFTTASMNFLEKIEIFLVGISEKNKQDYLNIELMDEEGNVIFQKDLSVGDIKNGEITKVLIGIDVIPQKEYTFVFKVKSILDESSLGILTVPRTENVGIGKQLSINNQEDIRNELYISYYGCYKNKATYNWSWTFALIFISLSICTILVFKIIFHNIEPLNKHYMMGTTAKYMTYISLLLLLICNIYSGFNLLNVYHHSQYALSYRFGWIPRGLVGQIGCLIFGDEVWYTGFGIDLFVFITMTLFLIWLSKIIYEIAFKKGNIAIISILAILLIVPILRQTIIYSPHCEGIVWCFIAVIYEMTYKKSAYKVAIASAFLCFVSVLISESNLFFVCPLLVSMTILYFVDSYDINDLIKSKLWMVTFYIPTCILSLYISRWKITDEMANKWIDFIHTLNLEVFSEIHIQNFYQRANELSSIYGIRDAIESYKHYGWSLIVVPLVVIFITLIQMYYAKAKKKNIICYLLLVFGSYLFVLSFRIIASDDYRSYIYSMFVVIILSIFTLHRYASNHVSGYVNAAIIIIAICVVLKYYNLQLDLAEWEHRSLKDFYDMIMYARKMTY